MKTIALYLAKKYALDALEKVTDANADKIAATTLKVSRWIAALESVTAFLRKLAAKLTDGVLTAEESEATMDDATALADEIKKELAA